MTQKITVVNIFSVRYSGSTWLNLLLGSHPEAFSAGELSHAFRDGHARCDLHRESCPVWSQIDLKGPENPFVRIAEVTGRRIIIVNSARKSLPFQEDPRIESRSIHLTRDLRAVLASFLRKDATRKTWSTSRRIAHGVRRDRRVMRRQGAERGIVVRYEDVQQDATAQLKRLCAFIGADYDPQMHEYWRPDHHFVGGNQGTIYGMLRRGERLADPSASERTAANGMVWDVSYYRNNDAARFTDERWKTELSNTQLMVFALWAGWANRLLGYPRALDRGTMPERPSVAAT